MADNIDITPGSGVKVRTKDRTTAHTQIVGLDLSPGSGSENLMTGTMPVSIAATVPVSLSTLGSMDLDTGGGTSNHVVVGLLLPASGGPVAAPGSAANGLLVDVSRVQGYSAQDAAVSGNPVLIGVRASTVQPTEMSSDGDAVHLWATRRGALFTAPYVVSPTYAAVAAATSSTQLAAANTKRWGCTIVNDSTNTLKIAFGSTPTATAFTYVIGPGETWEMPPHLTNRGQINGIWDGTNGRAQVTEWTD